MSFARGAALVALTAVAVLYLPAFFREEPSVFIDGFVGKGFEEIKDVFRENFETGIDPRSGGSAFSVYYRGEKVVDIWGGYADGEIKQTWREETMSIFFSTTKGVAAICIAMLVDRGLLDYDKPVAHYWPEFAQKGKGKITVKQMMEHQAGLLTAAPPGLTYELLRDVAKAGELLASTEPLWEVDGKTHGYHAITYGPLTNELLRRVDPEHRTMGQFFAEEVAKPFGIDFYIGLPLEANYRVARMPTNTMSINTMLLKGMSSPTNRQMMWHFMKSDLFQRSFANADLDEGGGFGNPYNRMVELPSASGIGTARSIAKLYSILAMGGTDPQSKKTLLSKQRVDDLMKIVPPTFDESLGVPIAYNLGMAVSDQVPGEVLHGHSGAGGQMGCADPTHQIGLAYLSTNMSPFVLKDDPRTDALLAALYRCVRKLEKN